MPSKLKFEDRLRLTREAMELMTLVAHIDIHEWNKLFYNVLDDNDIDGIYGFKGPRDENVATPRFSFTFFFMWKWLLLTDSPYFRPSAQFLEAKPRILATYSSQRRVKRVIEVPVSLSWSFHGQDNYNPDEYLTDARDLLEKMIRQLDDVPTDEFRAPQFMGVLRNVNGVKDQNMKLSLSVTSSRLSELASMLQLVQESGVHLTSLGFQVQHLYRMGVKEMESRQSFAKQLT
ncbi:unnamed protein product [Phytophthora lilii]|uniref:Unnamed protein product n=1 Tax=Phytophthora lilii TaxID=2077276 RepID=A0A9W6TPD3_9STRA|nr:unnamed protein product [Phytophthora lilii]